MTRSSAPPARALDAELLADEAVDLTAVGAAAGLLHDRADERAHRLGVAAADALDDVGVVLDHLRDDAGELARVVHRTEILALDDLGRVAAVGDELVEHDTGIAGVDRLG